MSTQTSLLAKSGIGQLTAILEEHLKLMKNKDSTVEKIISSAMTASSLRDAKQKALENEKTLLLSIMEDIDEMNTFLKNIILIENLFNSLYQPFKQKQEEARAKYAKNISNYENKPKCQSEAGSFVELIFGGQTHISSFQTWLDKVAKQCDIQNVKIRNNSGAKVKKIERAFYKAFYVYSEHDGFKEMTDLLRCSFVFDDFENLYQCFSIIEMLAEQTLGGILRVKDRYHPNMMPFGYRDLLINIYCPQSKIVAEVQLHFVEFYKYKKISHKMYKRARLFERDTGNLAYEYSTKFMRPKIGSFKVYEVSKDEIGDDDDDKEEILKRKDMKYDKLLKEWGLEKYKDKMLEEGWEDPTDWKELNDDDLKNDIGFSKGHIKKFKRKYQEWLKQIEKEEKEEQKEDIAVYQEQVYGNKQPIMQLHKEQGIEEKQEYNNNNNNNNNDEEYGEWDEIFNGKQGTIKNITIMAEICVSSNAGNGRIGVILGTHPKDPNINVEIHTNGRLRLYWNGGELNLFGNSNLCDDKKHIVGFVRDCQNSKMCIYLDGKLETVTNQIGSDKYMTSNFLIGKDYRFEGMVFKGDIFKINVFSKALNENMILNITNKWKNNNIFMRQIKGGNDYEIKQIFRNKTISFKNKSFTLITLIRIGSNTNNNSRVGVIMGTYPKSPNINFEVHQNGRCRLFWNNGQIDIKGKNKNLNDGKKHCIIFMRDIKNKNTEIYVDGEIECQYKGYIGNDFEMINNCFLFGRDYRFEQMQFKGDILRLNAYSTEFNINQIKQICDEWLGKNIINDLDDFKDDGDYEGGGILIKEFRKGSWNQKISQTLDFINTNLQNKGQLIDIGFTMSNTDWLGCIHIYYIKDVNTMKYFKRNPSKYINHGQLMCDWNRYSEGWMSSAQKGAVKVAKYGKIINNKLFRIKHACGNHAYTHGGPVIAVFNWNGITGNDYNNNNNNNNRSVLVTEFRKGSWNDRIRETLDFINCKLKNKGQLIDIGFTMSNTDWLACIHIYYIKDINTMKEFGRNPSDYINYAKLMCDWDRYSEGWMSSAGKGAVIIDKIARKKDKLFCVQHACGNHAYTHGGPVIATFYWHAK